MAIIAPAKAKRANAAIIIGTLSILVATASATALGAKAPATTEASLGQLLFAGHCAQCHGADGKGHGPIADVLKVAPSDLTTISKRSGGNFPAERIVETIRYGGDVTAHGTRDMPIWGKVFSVQGGGGKRGGAFSRQAVIQLKDYLESIQQR
ncbi:c-type cytochrome [Hyphomicrobium sp. ghe19]|uniref:c-type cytochrome n=1 Tax=Hyphomicrobium sp. ghe19 TaxID=2682968 RepID=UPI0013679A7D|nr:hypothetical protein HYPP_01348 [Hyphomicrobium sp. ghe19]